MIVGTAEVEVTANTAAFEKEMRDGTTPGFENLKNDAEVAGEDAGQGLTTGVKKETEKLGEDDELKEHGEKAGGKFGGGLKDALGAVGVPEALLSGWGALGIAAIGVGVAAFDMGEKMQTADTKIANSEGISVKAATAIGDAFNGTAFKSEYSGQQMAVAFAGVAGQLKSTEGHALSTADSLTVMKAASDLATASGGDLTGTTATLASVMQAFQTPVSQTSKVTDILYNAARSTGTSVEALGNTFQKIKSKMGAVAPDMSSMGALLVDMTNHGETGRAAMTALGTAFSGLVVPSGTLTKAQQAIADAQKKAGVSFQDSKGNLLGMGDIIKQVSPLIQGMSAAQATSTLTALGFGTAASKLVTTIQAGPDAFDKAAAAVTKEGTAHEAAERSAKTLHGTMETLKAGVVDLGSKLGEKLIPMVTKVADYISKFIQQVVKDWPTISKVFDNVMHTVKPILDGMIAVLRGVMVVIEGLIEFVVNVFQGKWGKAWDGIKKIFEGVVDIIKGIIREFVGYIELWFKVMLETVGRIFEDGFKKVVGFFERLPGQALAALGDFIGTVFGGLAGAWDWIKTNVYDPIVNGFEGLPGDIANAMSSAFGVFANVGKSILNTIISGINDVIDTIDQGIGGISIFGFHPPSHIIPDIPQLADGGVIKARPGGVLALLGEGGEDEAVIPKSQWKSGRGQGSEGNTTTTTTKTVTIGQVIVNAPQSDPFDQAAAMGGQLRLLGV